MVAGSKESLLELEKQLESVYPIKSEHHRGRFGKEHQGVEPQNMLVQGYCTNMTLDTLIFLLRVCARESEHSANPKS